MTFNPMMNQGNTLFVADLPKETTYEDLEIFFKNYHFQYAALNNSRAMSVWAKVCLQSEEYAKKARHELNGEILIPKITMGKSKGRPVRICNFEGKGSNNSEKNYKQSLLVKNLDLNVSQKEFYQLFLKYGEIDSAKIEYDENGASKGYGYIYYSTVEGADEAKKNLNKKEFHGKVMEIVNLIPFKSKTFNNNALFIMNFPVDFQESDLRQLFEKYGEIKYVSITRDKIGNSRGFGIITFDNFESTSRCIADTKANQISFPGLPPLVVKFAAKKEDRERKNLGNLPMNYDLLKIQFFLCYSTGIIENEKDLEKEIRLFIKVVLLQEYNPQEVVVDFSTNSGIVTFSTRKDYDSYIQKYEEFCMTRVPAFECYPLIPVRPEPPQMHMTPMINNPQVMYQNGIRNNHIPTIDQTGMAQMSPYPPQPNFQAMPQMIPGQAPVIGQNPQMVQSPLMPPPNIPIPLKIPIPGNFPNQPPPPGQNMRLFPNMVFLNNEGARPRNRKNQNINRERQRGVNDRYSNSRKPRGYNRYNNNHNNGYIPKNNGNHNNYSQNQQYIPMWPNPNPNMMNNMGQVSMMYGNVPNQPHPKFQIPNKNSSTDEIDQRNLENLNPAQLQSQFNTNQPVQHLFNPELFNHDENEEIANEIADSIYEFAYQKHPREAAKITGMIREMGIQKMNMLLSKKEDLYEMIDKAYDMIKDVNDKK